MSNNVKLTVAQVRELGLHLCNYCGNFPFGNGVEGPCNDCTGKYPDVIVTVPVTDLPNNFSATIDAWMSMREEPIIISEEEFPF